MSIKIEKCLGIDIGSFSVGISQCLIMGSSASCQFTENIPLDGWDPVDVINTFIETTRPVGGLAKHAVFSMPDSKFFCRYFKLPKAEEAKLKILIEHEASQQIPFPIENTVYSYQVFDIPDNEDEVRVSLNAIQTNKIVDFQDMISRINIKSLGISNESSAFMNWARYFSRESDKLSVYVHLGHKSTLLIVPDDLGMILFSRPILLGGNNITDIVEVTEGLNEKNANEFKRDLPGLNSNTNDLVEKFYKRLVGEIRRSLDYAITQPDGIAYDQMVVSGGMSNSLVFCDYLMKNSFNNFIFLCEEEKNPIPIGLALQGLGLGLYKTQYTTKCRRNNEITLLNKVLGNMHGRDNRFIRSFRELIS